MRLRILRADDLKRLLPMASLIELMRHAFQLVASGHAVQPIRQTYRAAPDANGLLSIMPGWIEQPRALGIKVITVFPGNFGTGLGSHQGVVILFDYENGSPLALVDARELTALRTAAATGAATDLLANKQARVLALFGYGEQADAHLGALLHVRNFERVIVWGRDSGKAEEFCRRHRVDHAALIEVASDRQTALAEADVVCTLTSSPTPVIETGWMRPGQHLNLVGSSTPTTAEVDSDTVGQAKYYVDYVDSARALAGELREAIGQGVVGHDHIVGSIGDVLLGAVAGRTSETDFTIFKSLGMAAQDLASAAYALRRAEQSDIGQMIDW